MLVADHNQAASSATLGVDAADKMQFSQDPALFMAMIANLYSNQKLAFVRESLCNHWDAHIAAGITDKPIFIDISEDYVLTMRDYGNGIPVSMMNATYNTLGGTTKRSDSGQTGGFGLGCKSPLAYVESFKVTTMNNGTKAVYNMVRSAVELDGCPGLVPIVQLPTEESGVEIQIQLQAEDYAEIRLYIESVVHNGEIRAQLRDFANDDKTTHLKMLGMSFEPGSYDHSVDWYRRHMGNHRIFIRYANVVYPALETPATEDAITVLKKFMTVIGTERILIQAAPDTLALSPSRETLSSQKMTEDGIVDMVVAATAKMEAEIKQGIPQAIVDIKEAIANHTIKDMHYCNSFKFYECVQDRTVRLYMLSGLYAAQRKHLTKEFISLLKDNVVSLFHMEGVTHKAYLRSLLAVDYNGWFHALYNYVVTNVVKQVKPKLRSAGIKEKNISYICKMHGSVCINETLLNVYFPSSFAAIKNILSTKLVFVTTRMRNLEESLRKFPDFVDGKVDSAFIVRCGTKRDDIDSTCEKLNKAGYTVVCLADGHEWDCVYQRQQKINKAKAAERAALKAGNVKEDKPKEYKPNRLVSLRCVLSDVGSIVATKADDTYWHKQDDVDKPLYYIEQDKLNHRRTSGEGYFNHKLGHVSLIPENLIDSIVVCRNKIEINKCIKRGAKPLFELLFAEAIKVFKSKEFIRYIKYENSNIATAYIYEADVTLLDALGIKYPAISKVKYDLKLDAVICFINSFECHRRAKTVVKSEQLLADILNFDEDDAFCKDVRNTIKQVGRIFSRAPKGSLLRRISNSEDALEIITQDPSLTPVIKRLVKQRLTENTHDETDD